MNLPAPLAKKIGPFPVWVWAGVGVGGIGLGLIIRRRYPSRAGVPPAEETEGVTAGYPGTGAPAGYQSSGAVRLGDGSIDYAPEGPTTNDAWTTLAVRRLISQGLDPLTADAAVRRYLRGDPLTTAEGQAVSAALVAVGPPPEGAPPIGFVPIPPPLPAAPPAPTGPGTTRPVGNYGSGGGETASQRIDRITAQIISGQRSYASVRASRDLITGGTTNPADLANIAVNDTATVRAGAAAVRSRVTQMFAGVALPPSPTTPTTPTTTGAM